ncbi:MAG: glycosyltransferase family 2 protein [Alphaproteobacteria bacterium]|nr:glycosyltransferase family 2 protein [Alphaproteobacteria bacterium]
MLSIVISTRNRARILPKTLAALKPLDAELVVVDNGSEDGTFALLVEHAKSEPRLVPLRNPRNLGMVRSYYRGILAAANDWVVLLSDEDELTAHYIGELKEIVGRYPKVGAILIPQAELPRLPGLSQPMIEPAGRRAATWAYYVAGHIGGLAFDRQRVDLAKLPLDGGIFTQRWIMCSVALQHDACFLPYAGRLKSEANPADKTEFALRTGDWAVGEWMDHLELVLNAPAASEFRPEDRDLLVSQLRLKVFAMFSLYMRHSLERGGPANTEALIRAVLADPRFSGDIVFWEVIFNDLMGVPESLRYTLAAIIGKARPSLAVPI